MSSSSSMNQPASPNSPVSPLTLPSSEPFGTPRLDPIIEHVKADHGQRTRASTVSGVSFKGGVKGSQLSKARPATRIRESSPPPPSRFQHHVSFDNFAGTEPTEKNTLSFTLNAKHKGYQYKRRSRTFMVGIDENDYSDIALHWMLEELVDDGDEIICLRVIDKDSKITNDRNLERRQYQKEARALMERIQSKNDDSRAISIVLEFAVGKVQNTFQKMIQIYEPAMLIVGTRGRSLGGFQGLVSNRNSFSKWCLQYSPIPVVVVRPTEKRMKKKKKRDADPTRQDYIRILRESGIKEHETEAGSANSTFEEANHPDVEAHAVAAALGLPAGFDPTLQPIIFDNDRTLRKVDSARSDVTSASQSSLATDSRPASPELVSKSPRSGQQESPGESEDEYSEGEEDDDEDGEFEAIPGHLLLANADESPEIAKRQKLHEMEMAEAAALAARKNSSASSADSSASPQPDADDNVEAEAEKGSADMPK